MHSRRGAPRIAMALYLEHFGLHEPPFRITPHTDFFFDGAERGATLEALAYAVLHDEGIVKVSGEVGSGKTMLCRMLMERLPAEAATIYLATPSLARDEILHAIADDLELKLPERRTVALRELQEHLIKLYGAGRRVVILIDEAHVMPEDTPDKALLAAYSESSHALTERHVKAAVADSEFAVAPIRRAWQPAALAGGALILGLIAGVGIQWFNAAPQPQLVPVQAAAPVPPAAP